LETGLLSLAAEERDGLVTSDNLLRKKQIGLENSVSRVFHCATG
jgi:hypothetical protein